MNASVSNESRVFCYFDKDFPNQESVDFLEKYFEDYAEKKGIDKVYIISKPLIEDFDYEFKNKAVIVLIPTKKILFLNLASGESEKFEDFVEDVLDDVKSLSDRYGFTRLIERPRKWRKNIVVQEDYERFRKEPEVVLNKLEIPEGNLRDRRLSNLIISLLIGSINDANRIKTLTPETVVEKVKQRIILFDTNQLKFIFKEPTNKKIFIQGLSGTGKTELLLHKIKELYLRNDDVRIMFTCHNKILANELKLRVREFFNFLKVPKQIDPEKLIIAHAWGSFSDPFSGAYSYICNHYQIPFYRYNSLTKIDFDFVCKQAIENIKERISTLDEEDRYAFDFMLIDESQDFPDSFFELCELVTKEKVYIAGDIFQDIFQNPDAKKIVSADFVLKKCYRTDTKTLMFAHALSMGLFESPPRLNWLTDEEWSVCGYIVKHIGKKTILTREPVRRFDDVEDDPDSVEIIPDLDYRMKKEALVNIVKAKITEFMEKYGATEDDIAIIFLDNDKKVYEIADFLSYSLSKDKGWLFNKGYESKKRIGKKIFISNRNNVKGLEFPFVFCVLGRIDRDYRLRNLLYTMLTRSFLKSILIVGNTKKEVENIIAGWNTIKEKKCVITDTPDENELKLIEERKTSLKLKQENKSLEDILVDIFKKCKISDQTIREMITQQVMAMIDKGLSFSREELERFVVDSYRMYSKYFK